MILTAAVAVLLVAGPARATNGMRPIGFGPVQDAMGGASVAAPLDGYVTITNPAGLAVLGSRLDVSVQGVRSRVTHDFGTRSDRPDDVLPAIAGVYRPTRALALGVAAAATSAIGARYEYGGSASYVAFRVAPALAYRIGDLVSVGVALNLSRATLGYEIGRPPGSRGVALGYGATVGATFTPAAFVTVGAAYETRGTFRHFDMKYYSQEYPWELDQPWIGTVGAALRPARGLLVAFDVQRIGWSEVTRHDEPLYVSSPHAIPQFVRFGWKDQWVVKAGVEAEIPGLRALKVRAGYDHGASPVDPSILLLNAAFPAIVEDHFTGGLGYAAGGWDVAAAVVYAPQNKVTTTSGFTVKAAQVAVDLGIARRF